MNNLNSWDLGQPNILLSFMKVLLKAGRADIKATTESNGDTILHILTRKAKKSNPNYKNYIECLKYALNCQDIDVEAKERSA